MVRKEFKGMFPGQFVLLQDAISMLCPEPATVSVTTVTASMREHQSLPPDDTKDCTGTVPVQQLIAAEMMAMWQTTAGFTQRQVALQTRTTS